mmetsp:Transcript_34804/g.98671  ORF Transcript_34804/g.98671 Transcript_34804/m.98671 type:complete len:412 (-) Transcript_34804:245-1480(-)|eukprot:CAMPEP_0117670068 /NCGR_PEP_ID=MMETSP0804-20121206/12520_1 /TAXON_ID=1074897 /ORGANISM="Tetraselmis astigmatica, Strain CCMP880" /LENGTH=411 /DNA_ID=CAMNT_0005478271 /DNA_START=66 /DNA_END=1301 /DNA_ORIENTATION=-
MAALSLKCDDCGAQLRSVAEAQFHGDATGHSNFSESTEAVLNLVCSECGKPCRSQTECDLHTKRTGHSNFVDKTTETGAINTEQQMKEARDIEMEGAKPNAAVEMVTAEVDPDLLKQLAEMGFPENRATRAIHFTGTDNIEQAITWIVEHEADPDIDEPLLVPKGSNKQPLSAEEAKAKAEDMLRKAREKRMEEEKQAEIAREKARINMGREMAAARKAEEEQQLKRNLMAREAEKAEAQRAMAKVKAQLEEDRRERRRKLGLPEELTEEEKAAEAAKAAEKAKASGTKMGVPIKPVSAIDSLRTVLVDMKKTEGEERAKVAWGTLLKYLGNIAKNPNEDKFRSIKLANEAFQKRVGSVHGGVEFLLGCGFQKDAAGEVLTMPRDKVDMVLINAAGGEINSALSNPFFGVL